VLAALKPVRTDVEIMANADACRINPKFADVIIPVEWVQDKRTIAKTKETLRRAAATFAAERLLMIFPSGALAQMRDGKLVDEPWLPTAVTLARKNKAPLTPLHINGRNSALYYRFCNINRELRDITLFHELLNKQGDKFHLTFGQADPVGASRRRSAGGDRTMSRLCREHPAERPRKPFEPLRQGIGCACAPFTARDPMPSVALPA
jgi:putative hemolysin